MHALLLLALCLPLEAASQAPPPAAPAQTAPGDAEPTARDVARRVAEAALSRLPTFRRLEELCRVAPRRLSGTDASERAIEWAEGAMRAAGLENVRREPVMVPKWVRGEVERLVVVEPESARGETLAIHALGGSVGTPEGGITAEIVRVTGFPDLEARAEAARGKIVLFDTPMETGILDTFAAYGQVSQYRVDGAAHAAAAGAIASLTRSLTQRIDDVPHTGVMKYKEGTARIPAVALSTRATQRVADWISRGERVVVRLELSCRSEEPVPSSNVIGEIVGREIPGEIVLVGGHLDSWDVGPGAHDDGAGSCHALTAAELLVTLGLRPRRTIRVVLFANEENGLAGARAYHESHRDELASHVLALESDRGGFAPRGFSSEAEGAVRERLAEILAELDVLGADRLFPGGGGADVAPLARDGVLTVGFVPDPARYFDVHHTAADTPDSVHPRELELGTAAIATLIHAVANAPERIDGKPADGGSK